MGGSMNYRLFVVPLVVIGTAQAVTAQTRPSGKEVDPTVLVRKQEVLLSPFPVETVTFRDPVTGAVTTVAWSTLTPAKQREQLPNEELFIEISKIQTDGSIAILPAKVTAEKGSYEFTYRWMKYRIEHCNASNPEAGHVRVGVALEITVNASTRKANLNVAGIGPFQAAASDDRFSGALTVGTIGLGTNSAALGGFLGNSAISEHAAAEADKAIAVVKAVIENNDTKLTPHKLAVIERTPGACTGALPRPLPQALKKL